MELTANLEEIKDAKNRTRDEIVGYSGGKDSEEVRQTDTCYTKNYFIALCNRVSSW